MHREGRGNFSNNNHPLVKNSRRHEFNHWVGTMPWTRKWQPTPVSLPGESHGQRSLAGYRGSHGVTKESDTTEQINNNKKR